MARLAVLIAVLVVGPVVAIAWQARTHLETAKVAVDMMAGSSTGSCPHCKPKPDKPADDKGKLWQGQQLTSPQVAATTRPSCCRQVGKAPMSPVCSRPNAASTDTSAEKTADRSVSCCKKDVSGNCCKKSDVTTGRAALGGLQ